MYEPWGRDREDFECNLTITHFLTNGASFWFQGVICIAGKKGEDWDWVMDINLMGVVRGCKVFIPVFKRQGGGHIINTAAAASFVIGLLINLE